jgi:predicted DNA-binding protein with PD1-like motif
MSEMDVIVVRAPTPHSRCCLLEGQVFPTLEVVVTETPAELRKVMSPDLGIALIDLDRSES